MGIARRAAVRRVIGNRVCKVLVLSLNRCLPLETYNSKRLKREKGFTCCEVHIQCTVFHSGTDSVQTMTCTINIVIKRYPESFWILQRNEIWKDLQRNSILLAKDCHYLIITMTTGSNRFKKETSRKQFEWASESEPQMSSDCYHYILWFRCLVWWDLLIDFSMRRRSLKDQNFELCRIHEVRPNLVE